MATQPPEDVRATPESDNEPRSRWRTLPFLLIIAAALVVVAILGFQLITILYLIIFPPNVVLPADAVELEHEHFGYGSDRWEYGTSIDACRLVAFFEDNESSCILASSVCIDGQFSSDYPRSQNVGTCYGQRNISIFGMRWQVSITSGYETEPFTRFELTRDVLWFGLPDDEYIPPELTETAP